jgi:hypothetical protein
MPGVPATYNEQAVNPFILISNVKLSRPQKKHPASEQDAIRVARYSHPPASMYSGHYLTINHAQ